MSSKKLLWLLPLCMLAACSQGGRPENDKSVSAATESAKTDSVNVSSVAPPINSPDRKIIHTADFHCMVKDVFTATTKLEQMVKLFGGIVQESHMDNSGYDTRTSYYTTDSLRETRIYTTTSFLTLRVPAANLDSVVNAIPALTTFIDSRTLRQSDVTYQYLANVLKNHGDNNLATDRALQLARKSHEPIEVEEYEDRKRDQNTSRKIENLNLADNVAYATLTVAFSQPQQVFVQTIVNPQYSAGTPFSVQCQAAVANGSAAVRAFAVFLITIWPLLLLLLIAGIIFRKLRNKQFILVKK